MSFERNHSFVIEEVTSPKSQHMIGMDRWLEEIFPEYCPSRFDKLLEKLHHSNGRHQIQIYISVVDNLVTGLLQIFYQEWQGGLLADIDLLGVIQPFRRLGLGLSLVQKCLQATTQMARQYQIPAVGVVSLIDQTIVPIVRLHQKQGGQIREDYKYPSGDIIVWYPLRKEYEDVSTLILGEQLRLFGKLFEK